MIIKIKNNCQLKNDSNGTLEEVGSAIWVQILIEAVYTSHIDDTLGKSINPTIIPPAMGK